MYAILLVDDEKTIRQYLPRAIPFERYGFRVMDTAMNGREALDKLPLLKPDLILLDIRMPVMDGLQFLEQLRQGEFANTMVVMLSGYSDFAYAKSAIQYGVEAYLNKPVDEDEMIPLLEKIRQKLDGYHHEIKLGQVRKQLNLLNQLYQGAGVDRQLFGEYTLMTCVMLQDPNDCEAGNPHIIMQQCLAEVLGELENYLFRTHGSQYTFLIPREIFEAFAYTPKRFSDHLLERFKQYQIDCALLFDAAIFRHPQNTFREDFCQHLNLMLTELFFAPTEFTEYKPDRFKMSEELFAECKYLEEIRQYFAAGNQAETLKTVEKLLAEVRRVHLGVHSIQEIGYRIYYSIMNELMVPEPQNYENAILARPEWLDSPYFLSFQQWQDMLLALIKDGLEFVERKGKMVNLGLSGEVIAYIHLHYREPISLKQVADQFFVNAAYLGRAFQKATGVNFKHYVNQIRIAEAKKLLLHTNKLIYEVAAEVGYNESKYFVVKFTQEVGQSPTEYRNQCC